MRRMCGGTGRDSSARHTVCCNSYKKDACTRHRKRDDETNDQRVGAWARGGGGTGRGGRGRDRANITAGIKEERRYFARENSVRA